MIKHEGHLRTRGKCTKNEPQECVFYISFVFSNVRSILSRCNTRLRLLHLLYDIEVMWKKTIKHTFTVLKKPRLCSVLLQSTQEAVEHERSVGENTRRSPVFFPTSWVLYRFLSALQQNRAQSRLLYLFYDKESDNFPTHWAEFSNQTLFSKRAKVASAVHCSLIKHAKISQSQSLLELFK